MKLSRTLLLAGLLLAGCSTLETRVASKVDLSQFKRIYVEQNLNDNHRLDLLIVRQLQARGIEAESGPLTLMPREVKTYLVYDDHWEWDFKDTLISLNIILRDAASDRMLATASFTHPTAFLNSPAYMVQTAITDLFRPTNKSLPGSSGDGAERPAGPRAARSDRGPSAGSG